MAIRFLYGIMRSGKEGEGIDSEYKVRQGCCVLRSAASNLPSQSHGANCGCSEKHTMLSETTCEPSRCSISLLDAFLVIDNELLSFTGLLKRQTRSERHICSQGKNNDKRRADVHLA
jgi:hypothetical protein